MKTVTAREVEEQLNSNEALNIIDVREPFEVGMGKIPSAQNIPLGSLADHIDQLDKSKTYIMVCQSGGRSMSATAFLEGQGFDVINMTGGMMSWEGDVE